MTQRGVGSKIGQKVSSIIWMVLTVKEWEIEIEGKRETEWDREKLTKNEKEWKIWEYFFVRKKERERVRGRERKRGRDIDRLIDFQKTSIITSIFQRKTTTN